MKNILLPLALLSFSTPTLSANGSLGIRDNSVFNLITNGDNQIEITGVNDNSLYEYRIYSESISNIRIESIGNDAFSSCSNMTSIMITSDIVSISDNAFNGCSKLTSILYTGSLEEFKNKFGDSSYDVFEYSYDEGFINYWNNFIRVEETSNLCDISKDLFNSIYAKYSALSPDDKDYVNSYVDVAGINIKSSMDFLIGYFNETPSKNIDNKEMNKTTALSLILTASIIGMTSICVFFFFKSKNIID